MDARAGERECVYGRYGFYGYGIRYGRYEEHSLFPSPSPKTQTEGLRRRDIESVWRIGIVKSPGGRNEERASMYMTHSSHDISGCVFAFVCVCH